jgi:hypothetical protein
MQDTMVRTLGFSVGAIGVLGTGVSLTRSGWPYGPVMLNVHKLVALTAVVVLGVLVYRVTRVAPLSAADWAVVVSAGLLCLAGFASGGAVTAMESAPTWVLWVHRVGTWFAIGAVAMCLVTVA